MRSESALAKPAPVPVAWIGFIYGHICEKLDGRDKVFSPVERYWAMGVAAGRQHLAGKLQYHLFFSRRGPRGSVAGHMDAEPGKRSGIAAPWPETSGWRPLPPAIGPRLAEALDRQHGVRDEPPCPVARPGVPPEGSAS